MDFASLLRHMHAKKASDLFLSAGFPASMKIDGQIEAVTDRALTPQETEKLAYSLLPVDQRDSFRRRHEANFAISPDDLGRFRVNAFHQQNHCGLVLRRIETDIPPLASLGLPAMVQELAGLRQGLVLVVGATGAGKSTTLAAMVDARNRRAPGHIVCIEDPIEFVHRPRRCLISQREVGIDTDSYASALRNTLRQAPDMVVIGEARERETVEHALRFAETGHLCLTTLHANNAVQALERIVTFFGEEQRNHMLMDLSLNLRAIVAQRLVPDADGQGRRLATEVLLNTPLIAEHIRHHRLDAIKTVMAKSENQGMRTFEQSLFQLFENKQVSYDEALNSADSPNNLRLMIKLGQRRNNVASHAAVKFQLMD